MKRSVAVFFVAYAGDPDDYPFGHGPQGDVVRIFNHVRVVRDDPCGGGTSGAGGSASSSERDDDEASLSCSTPLGQAPAVLRLDGSH
jgi:hypothetical protein